MATQHAAPDRATQDAASGHGVHTHHPTARTYGIVGAFLTLITVVEV